MTDRLIATLLDRHGRTYAEEAGIRLADRPEPLYQLLAMTTMLSTRVQAEIGVAAAREMFRSGLRTPRAMADASWQDRVDALDRAHYKRYDERIATLLGDSARLCLDRWRGDLRRLRAEAGGQVRRLRSLLDEFPGIGPTGADIFLREVQAVWPEVGPYVDRRVAAGAQRLGLPTSGPELAKLADGAPFSALASALVRISLNDKLAENL